MCGQAPPSSMALMVSNSSVANLAFAAGGLQLSSLKARNGASESLAWWYCRTTTRRTVFSHCVSVRSGSLWLRRSVVEEEELLWKPKKPASASSTSLRLRRISAAANESTLLFFFFFFVFFFFLVFFPLICICILRVICEER